MIRIVITVETDNAAFGESAPEKYAELARMLKDTDWSWAVSADRANLRDINGNTVGSIVSKETTRRRRRPTVTVVNTPTVRVTRAELRREQAELDAERDTCPSCWSPRIDCTEGCGEKICTCNISTHECP